MMTRDEKLRRSVLRTKEGAKYREDMPDRPRLAAPAFILDDSHPVDSMTVYYDSPANLRHKALLRPMKIKDHRVFFPEADWLAEQRRINQNLARMQKERVECDLTGDDDGREEPQFRVRSLVKVEPGGANLAPRHWDQNGGEE